MTHTVKVVRNILRWLYEIRIALVVAAFVGCFLYVQDIPARVREDVVFRFYPSAQRAYEYGDVHFRALNSRQYDIDRAEYWYENALEIDSQFPGAHHQLARVAFLRGEFQMAMVHINAEINSAYGPVTPSSYYIRGLIEGYMGEYAASAKDYEKYLESDPHNWAAMNDYAWVLLKGERFEEAANVIKKGLVNFPENPWLLSSYATALYELGDYASALQYIRKAYDHVSRVSERQWLLAYPGNDPKIAQDGVEAFRKAVANNMHMIEMKIASSTVQ